MIMTFLLSFLLPLKEFFLSLGKPKSDIELNNQNLPKKLNGSVGNKLSGKWESDSLFVEAVAELLKHEGGYVDHPNDRGGATNWGISFRFYKSLKPDATKRDIRELTLDAAKQIYYEHWWVRYGYRALPFSIGKRVFSFAVNMPSQSAHKLLQRAIRAATGEQLLEDGVLGEKTIAAAKAADTGKLLGALRSEAAGYYRSLAAKNPSQKVFLKGWLNRAYA